MITSKPILISPPEREKVREKDRLEERKEKIMDFVDV